MYYLISVKKERSPVSCDFVVVRNGAERLGLGGLVDRVNLGCAQQPGFRGVHRGLQRCEVCTLDAITPGLLVLVASALVRFLLVAGHGIEPFARPDGEGRFLHPDTPPNSPGEWECL